MANCDLISQNLDPNYVIRVSPRDLDDPQRDDDIIPGLKNCGNAAVKEQLRKV